MADQIGKTGRERGHAIGAPREWSGRALAVAVLAGLIACAISGEGWAQLKAQRKVFTRSPDISPSVLGPPLPNILRPPSLTPPDISPGLGGGGLGGDPPDESAGRGTPPVDLDDIVVSRTIAEYGTKALIIQFHPESRIRVQAMRSLLETTYKDLLKATAAKAVEVIIAHKADLEQQLAEVEDSWLSPLYWQTKDDLRRNIEEIRKGEGEAKRLEQQGLEEAWRQAQAWNPKFDWSTHGSVEISTGTAFQQLQHISINGWGGF